MRVEEVDPGQAVSGANFWSNVPLEGVDDRAGPEPRREDHLDEVLHVAQIHVDGGEEHRQGRQARLWP